MFRFFSSLMSFILVLCLTMGESGAQGVDELLWNRIAEGDFRRSREEIERTIGTPTSIEPDVLLRAISVHVARYEIAPGHRRAREGRIYYRGGETLGFATLYETSAKDAVDDFVREEGGRVVYRGEYASVARARYNHRVFLAVVTEGAGSVAYRVRDELFEAMAEEGDIPLLRPGCDNAHST